MFRRSALPVLSRLALLVTAATLAAAAGQTGPVSRWYFLAATPTPDLDRGYPATLYTTAAGSQKLQLVRQVVSAADGVDSVLQYGNTIFVDYPHLPPTTAAIIHADQPTLSDSVVFNPAGELVLYTYSAVTEPQPHSIDELVWIFTTRSFRPGGTDTIIGVAGAPAGPGKRIQPDALQEYSSVRFDGIPGGPYLQPGLAGVPVGDSIDVKIAGSYVPIEQIPDDIAQKIRGEFGPLVAATDRYFIFGLQQPRDDSQSGTVLNRSGDLVMVHGRVRNKWFTGPREGTCSFSRMFGDWLTTVVGYWNPDHGPQPGVAHQRAVETDALPAVKGVYDVYHGKECFIPGYLALWNLESGQRVAWHTDEEDSEILWVGSDTVLYRVNDTIYQARIVGDKLQDNSVLVKDDDVPEIHWVFWGP